MTIRTLPTVLRVKHGQQNCCNCLPENRIAAKSWLRSEEHTSELQSRPHLVCRLLLEKKKKTTRDGSTRSSTIMNISCTDPDSRTDHTTQRSAPSPSASPLPHNLAHPAE